MNFLDDLLSEAINYLSQDSFVTNTKEIHLKSKVNPDAEDEVFENVNQIIDTDDYDDYDDCHGGYYSFRDFEDE